MAHNEESGIETSLRAVLSQDCFQESDKITVIENGSTDRTAEIVTRLARENPAITLCSLALGDKANAWSHYCFNISPSLGAQTHVFLDGDVVMRAGALRAIAQTLAQTPAALAVSCLPYGGRTAEVWRARVLREHGLPGNCYALRDTTLTDMRDGGWRLPVGYMGDDTFLQWILKRRFDPLTPPDKTAIQPAAAAGFDYASISATSLSGLYQLYKRQRAYAMRDIQSKLLADHLKADPTHRPPRDIAALYGNAKPWTALFGPFGALKPFKIRKLLSPYTWWRTQQPPRRTGAAWYQ